MPTQAPPMGNRPIPLRTITLHDPSQSLRGRFHRHTRKRTTQSSRAHHTHQPYASPTAAMRIPSTKGRHSARPSILVSVWSDALFKKNLPPLMRSSTRRFVFSRKGRKGLKDAGEWSVISGRDATHHSPLSTHHYPTTLCDLCALCG